MDQKGRRQLRPSDLEADPRSRLLAARCEIVLHDYRAPAVAGKAGQRRVGSAMSEIGLSPLTEGRAAQDRLNNLAKAPNGRVINSSTIVPGDTNPSIFAVARQTPPCVADRSR